MNTAQRKLLFAISDAAPCSFAALSIETRMPTDYLSTALDSLQERGFVRLWKNEYTLAPGVLDFLHHTTEKSAVTN